jgi:predicted nucleic acid-binding protein
MGLRGVGTASGGGERPDGVIRYLLDSSALWRILRDDALREAWADVLTAGAVGSCHPQRVEFRRSARSVQEYEQMSGMFDALYPEATVPKGAWRWVESAQYRLLRQGAHRALSAIDLLICATAAQHALVVLHDDKDFVTAARYLPDVRERSVHHTPQGD